MNETRALTRWFAPRPRAHTPRALVIIGVALGLAGATLAPAAAQARGCRYAHARVSRTRRPDLQRAVVCLINQQRSSHHLPRLRENQRLNRSAQGWTNVMVRHHEFTHGSDFAGRISAVGFNWKSVGENIAAGFATPAAVVRGWMGSTGHCQNILNPTFRDVGTGVDRGRIMGAADVWTQDFALSMNSRAPSHNWGPADRCPY
jgi:uncharacterized protein YkwD